MSTTIMSEQMIVSTQESSQTTTIQAELEIQFIKCECCGLTEECTPTYIEKIRERYMGKWICGLCSEAVKDEVVRSERLITTEEALNRHVNVCRKFRSSCPPAGGDPTAHLITAMRSILRRSLDGSRGGLRSAPASPTRDAKERPKLVRSGSCIPDL
ncbi:uncharacterized protein LOC141613601 [Silene latifolia]|uniref:uncharacterized protein LOC141613601 n=1 Tax=Silene latifolia TaxID=37657 RepID=UPI003D779EC0